MSYIVDENNNITLTRGDTFRQQIEIEGYEVGEEDSIVFSVKKNYSVDDDPIVLRKEISTTDMMLVLEPSDTKTLSYGTYFYDVQLTMSDGTVTTFIPSHPTKKCKLTITNEVSE